ncbi:MAG: mechanosensitive ion channel [Notoacmeibacter sp.]|nr:mechanosensitive ion channel [Notoacmeibacter sp.]
MTLRALFLALLLLLPLGPALAQEVTEPNGTIATSDKAPSDRDIDRRIEQILNELDGLKDVFATVKSGVVTLRGHVAEPALIKEAEKLAARVEGVVAVRNEIAEETSVAKRIVPAWERIRNRTLQIIYQLPMIGLSALVFAIIALIGFWIAARRWPYQRIAPNSFIADLLRQIVRLAFLGLGLVVALDVLGATAVLGTVLGAAGIVGLAVGFAVRDTVENYIASILLSIRQPFRPNDWVEIGDEEGSVVMLTSRATILMDAGGNHVRIPNSTVFKGVIRNFTRNPERRFDFRLGIDPAANQRAAMDLGIATIRALPFTLNEPEADAWICDVGDSAVEVQFTGWVDQSKTSFTLARSEAIRLVKHALESAGFGLPEPGYRIILSGGLPPLEASKGKARQAPAPASTETADAADTSADDTISRKVEEERAQSDANDLLDARANQEIG